MNTDQDTAVDIAPRAVASPSSSVFVSTCSAGRVFEEVYPISMVVSALCAASRRVSTRKAYAASTLGAAALVWLSLLFVAPAAHAQKAATPATTTGAQKNTGRSATPVAPASTVTNPPVAQKSRATTPSAFGLVPMMHKTGMGDGRRLPADVQHRSLTMPHYTPGRKPAKNAQASTRVQIGTVASANVNEKVVNLTIKDTVPDIRTPFWSPDEKTIYYSSNIDPAQLGLSGENAIAANGRYHLVALSSGIPSTLSTVSVPVALNATTDAQDYLFPAINANSNYITFIRSSDGKSITDATKTWVLCYASLPAVGSTIDPAATTLAGGSAITFPNAAGQLVPFANVQRPTWLGNNNIIFSGLLQGDTSYHLFQVNLQPTGGQSIIFQLTAGPADERNPAVAADGKTLAFDSTALPVLGPGGTEGYGTAGLPRTVGLPANVPTTSLAVNAATTNGQISRNIFTMNLVAIADPNIAGGVLTAYTARQFTNREVGAVDTDNVEPAWSSLHSNPYLNPGGQTQQREYLSWASTRIPTIDPSDTTGTTITGYTQGTLHHIFYSLATNDGGNTIVAESAPTTTNGAYYLDTGDSISTPLFDDEYPTWSPFLSAFRIAFQSDRNGDYLTNNFDGYVPTGQGTNSFTATPGRNSLFVATVIDTTAPTLLRWDLNNTQGEVLHINLVTNPNEPFNPAASVRNSDDGVVPGSTIHIAARVEDRESGLRPDKAVYIQVKNPNSKYQSLLQGSTNPGEHKEYVADQEYTYYDTTHGYYYYENATGTKEYGREFEAEALGITNNITTLGNVLVNSGTMGTTYYGHSFGLGQIASSFAAPANDILYEAGMDDVPAFSGLTPLDGTAGTPAVWLELKPLYQFDATTGNPILDSSGNQKPWLPTDLGTNQPGGGVLYGASLKLPDEPSDWYIDVILYDNAVNPFNTNQKYNTIIYDNVWGFSSAPPITPRPADILVVSDYALGQKFFNARFASLQQANISNNLLPVDYGAESYVTDVTVDKFLDNLPFSFPAQTPDQYGYPFGPYPNSATGTPNILGVKAYGDGLTASTSQVIDGFYLADVNRYNIWRILSRGPLTTNVLNAYLPTLSTRNPDVFPNPATSGPFETAAQPVVNAQRMVVWESPFSGDLFTGQGTIVDTQTQNNLQNFVSQGGRLFLSGQDIAYALTSNGQTANPFLTNVVQVKFTSDTSPVQNIVPAGPTGGNYTTRIQHDPWTRSQHNHKIINNGVYVYNPPDSTPFIPLTSDINTIGGDGAATVGTYYAGGAFSDDVVTVAPTSANSSVAVWNHGGAQGMTVSTFGSGVTVFASFDYATLSNDYYLYTPPGSSITYVVTYGRRSEIMHNIVCSLRSGTIIGQVIDTSGSPVANALVRATTGAENVEASGTAISDSSGHYTITGLQPDAYTIYAYKNGYYSQHNAGAAMHGTGTAQVNLALKPANPGSLSGFAITAAPAGNKGGVYLSDGKTPLQGITIQVRQQDLTNGLYDIVAASTTSGVDGSYSLPSVPIGNYVIIANPSDQNKNYNPNVATVQLTATPSAGFALSAGETVNADNTVTIAENTSFFANFFLAAAPQKVNGIVESAAAGNPPIAGAIVTAKIQGGTATVASAVTDANGDYSLTLINPTPGSDATLIPAGTYVITATKTGFAANTVTITIGGNAGTTLTIPTIYLTQLPPGTVEGLVAVSSGSTTNTAGAAGAVVDLYPIITVNGVQQPDTSQAPLTGTVSATVTSASVTGYDDQSGVTTTETAQYNFVINNVPAGSVGNGNQYIAILNPGANSGLTPSPAQEAVVVFTGTTTFNVNFLLQPPHTYSTGVVLLSLPGDYSNVPDTAGIFGFTPLGDNNGNGIPGETADLAIYNAFNVADWTGTAYVISPNIRPQAGKGYFVNFGASAGVVEKGTPITSSSFTISLTNGWNLIGNPFNDQANPTTAAASLDLTNSALVTYTYTATNGVTKTNVPLSTAVADGAVQSTAYYYTGSVNGSQYIASSLLQGYSGYWFRAYVPVQMTLTYPGSSTTGRAAKMPVSVDNVFRTITRAEADAMTPMATLTSTGLTSWAQRISVRQGDLQDNDNSIGVQTDAHGTWDNRYDREKPPVVSSDTPSIRLAFQGTNASGRSVDLTAQTVPPASGTKSWNFTVTSTATTGDPVVVSWPDIDRLPRGIEPILVDLTTGKRTAMRTGASSFSYKADGKAAHAFRIDVAPPASLPLDIVNLRTAKSGTGRSVGATSFRFSFTTTRDADVRTEVLTMSGKVVHSASGRAAAGAETSVTWDGKNVVGASAPVGPYVVDIKATDATGAQVERKVLFMNL